MLWPSLLNLHRAGRRREFGIPPTTHRNVLMERPWSCINRTVARSGRLRQPPSRMTQSHQSRIKVMQSSLQKNPLLPLLSKRNETMELQSLERAGLQRQPRRSSLNRGIREPS